MNLKNKNTIITGAGSGIGAELARRFAQEGANVIVADINLIAAENLAHEIGGIAVKCDVSKEVDIIALTKKCESTFGPVDLFCSNAGLALGEPHHAASAGNDVWSMNWNVHVMSHVYAARAVLPDMIKRGEGYLVNMASAAGLLNQIGDAAYSATKHAAVGFSEALAITHGDDGIKVSVICPQYVATPLTGYYAGEEVSTKSGTISVATAADAIMKGIEEERFMILTHQQVESFMQNKTANYDRWVGGMRKMRRDIIDQSGSTELKAMHKFI